MTNETKSKEEAIESVRKFYSDYFQNKIKEFEEGLKKEDHTQLVATPIEIPGLYGKLGYGLRYWSESVYAGGGRNTVPSNSPTIQGCHYLKARDFELQDKTKYTKMRKYRMLLVGPVPAPFSFKGISYTSEYNKEENPRMPFEGTSGKIFGIVKDSHNMWEREGLWVFTAPLEKLVIKVTPGFCKKGVCEVALDFEDKRSYNSGVTWDISQRKFNQLSRNPPCEGPICQQK